MIPRIGRAADSERRTLASGVFMGGSAPLVLGARYMLVVRGDDLQILGPVDTRPDQIVLSRRISDLDSTGLGDRLVIVGATKRLEGFSVAFSSLGGRSAQDVDRILYAARTDAQPAGRPRSS